MAIDSLAFVATGLEGQSPEHFAPARVDGTAEATYARPGIPQQPLLGCSGALRITRGIVRVDRSPRLPAVARGAEKVSRAMVLRPERIGFISQEAESVFSQLRFYNMNL